MTLHMLRIVVVGKRAEVLWQRARWVEPYHATTVPFTLSFDLSEHLKWYFRYYNGEGSKEIQERVRYVKREMRRWGQQLFEVLFSNPLSPKSLIFFHEAVRAGLERCELVISSDNGDVLNMPWELIYSPDYHYLVPQFGGMYRTWKSHSIYVPFPHLSKKPLNILLVVCRPFGKLDLNPAILARPLLQKLAPLIRRGHVTLKILRPPTFLQLSIELNENKGRYHIVHFDGHGLHGKLFFEDTLGEADMVAGKRMVENLRGSRVPIFILDACHSGLFVREKQCSSMDVSTYSIGSFPAASLASRLFALGAKAVIAMGYSVYAEASLKFMLKFYDQLLNGKTVAQSVAVARRLLLIDPERLGSFGSFRLHDWMVPVLYQQEQYKPLSKSCKGKSSFPVAVGADFESLRERQVLVGLPDTDPSDFIGREFEISSLERWFQESNIVLLTGGKGNGKTELSLFLARTLVRTSGRQRAFYRSFKDTVTLQMVLKDIGETLMGEQFGQLDFTKQRKGVINYLRSHPCLLIWDHLDSVKQESRSKLSEKHGNRIDELSLFLRKLVHRQTWILAISRHDGEWLRCRYRRMRLRGLSKDDQFLFAVRVLEGAGILPSEVMRRTKLDYDTVIQQIELLTELLDGNPLCIQSELPKLAYMTPEELITEIRENLKRNNGVIYV